MPNPTSGGMEFGAAIAGVLVGGLATVLADRFTATHALTVNGTTVQDSPASGQTYNAQAPSAPLWSNPIRLAVAAASIVAPFIIAKMVRGGGAKSFFQLWGFAGLTVTTVKLGTDGAAKLLGAQTTLSAIFPRLFAQEIDAANAADYVKTATNTLAAYTLQAGGTGPNTTYGLSATSKTLGAEALIPPGGGVSLPHATPVIPGIQPPGRLITETIPPQQAVPISPTSPLPVDTTTPVPGTPGSEGGEPPDEGLPPDGIDPDPWACPPFRAAEPGVTPL